MPMPTVVMKAVPEFPGYYVKSDGTVWSAWKTRGRKNGGRGVESYISNSTKQLFPSTSWNKEYVCVTLRKDGKSYCRGIHCLVLETFKGVKPTPRHECCHKNGVKTDNQLFNLYWGTRKQNTEDSIRHGTFYNATKAAALVTRGVPRSDEAKAKISASHKGKKHTDEHNAAVKANHWSKGPNAAEIIKRSAAKQRGRKHTKEHRTKISNGLYQAYAEGRR